MTTLTEFVQHELDQYPELKGMTVQELMRTDSGADLVDAILRRESGRLQILLTAEEPAN